MGALQFVLTEVCAEGLDGAHGVLVEHVNDAKGDKTGDERDSAEELGSLLALLWSPDHAAPSVIVCIQGGSDLRSRAKQGSHGANGDNVIDFVDYLLVLGKRKTDASQTESLGQDRDKDEHFDARLDGLGFGGLVRV